VDYPTVAAELIPTLGAAVVAAADIRAGQRVLDVVAGSGNAAIPAAARGAIVTASDLTPELFVAGRAAAAVGRQQHVRDLFGNRVTTLDMRRHSVVIDHFADPTEFREFWKRHYGPTIAVYRHNAAHPDRTADLDRDFLQFLTTWNRADAPGRTRYEAGHLLVTARKR
jgi:SAM-dependent methyltransferase